MTKAAAPENAGPHFVSVEDVRRADADEGDLVSMFGSIGARRLSDRYVEEALGLPLHLRFALERMIDKGEVPSAAATRAAGRDDGGGDAAGDDSAATLASIPFYSLCRGLFLPLSQMQPERAAALFHLEIPPPPDAAAREQLLTSFLQKDTGLNVEQKLACVLGDPFLGRHGGIRRDSMVAFLRSVALVPRRNLIDRLAVVGDIAILWSEHRPYGRVDPPLTAAEVLAALRFFPDSKKNERFEVLRSLLARMGRLEAYFLGKLVLRRAAFGFDYQGPLLARVLAERFGADPEHVSHAAALTDFFRVARLLDEEGPAGLRSIQLQPLSAVRPALASQSSTGIESITRFPVWVERKYDGIRMMLHRSTDAYGNVLVGAYTRTKQDWLDLVVGLSPTIRAVGQGLRTNFIVDGELHGTVLDMGGSRPATVYDVYAHLQGQPQKPVKLMFTAFDLLYVGDRDITALPLHERRRLLQQLVGPYAGAPLPVPLDVSDGQQAPDRDAVQRLFHYFQGQGYEGVIAKDLQGTYHLGARDPSWVKRKPAITLDLVLLAGVFAVTTKETTGLFGSYAIGARRNDGSFEDVGDVAGLDVERDQFIQAEIVREGLITGRRVERASASGARAGLELRPHLVVTIRFEGITRDTATGRLSLRDPKIVALRTDKHASDADTLQAIEALAVRERFG